MTALIIYHQVKPGTDCPDGIAAAWVAAKKYPDFILQGWTYDAEGLPHIPGNCDRIVIVDFSFPAKVLEDWREQGYRVIVIDHHKTAMAMLEGLSDRVLKVFDMEECGATLAWKTFFYDEPTPALLEYVRDRDLWNFNLPLSQDIHEAVSSMRYGLKRMKQLAKTFDLFDGLAKLSFEELQSLGLAIGGPLLAPKREKINAAAKRAEIECVVEWDIPVVRLAKDGSEDRLTSDICMKLYTELYPDYPFVACITSDGAYSLRSNKHNPDGGFDVGALAKSQGGGGHHNASGFKL